MSVTTGASEKQIRDAVDRKLGYSVTWPEEAKEAYRRQEYELVKHEARYLILPTHVIIPRAYLDALEALLDAGDSRGISDGRAAAEHVWQDAEDEKDAAREEMGL